MVPCTSICNINNIINEALGNRWPGRGWLGLVGVVPLVDTHRSGTRAAGPRGPRKSQTGGVQDLRRNSIPRGCCCTRSPKSPGPDAGRGHLVRYRRSANCNYFGGRGAT
jgi:hypothetical protein